jgi:hypothetical protein
MPGVTGTFPAALGRLRSPPSPRVSGELARRPATLRVGGGLLLAAVIAVLAWQAAGLRSSTRQPPANAGRAPSAALASALSRALGASLPAYRVHGDASGLSAENPAHHLFARFRASGLTVSAGGSSIGLQLASVRSGASETTPAPLTPTASSNRVLYSWPGVSEWYANGPSGLEQGFTLEHPSGGSSTTLTLRLSGAARASRLPDGSLRLTPRVGSSLRYGALSAVDSRGRGLASDFSISGSEVQIVIDTRNAAYPVRVDPLVQEYRKLNSTGPQELAQFGSSVAVSADGNTALVGAPRDSGHAGGVLVFVRSGSEWQVQGPELTAGAGDEESACAEGEGGEEGEACGFGSSVALSADGNTAVIGGPVENESLGAARVFTRSGGTWTEQAELEPGAGEEGNGALFGRGVAISADGQVAMVGAPMDHAGRGAAWVFTRAGSEWQRAPEILTPAEESGEGRFGRRISLSADGSSAVIGAPTNGGDTGAAWVFTRGQFGWTQTGLKLTGGGEVGQGRFGYGVAISPDGSEAVIGGREDAEGLGAVWTFTRGSGGFAQRGEKLTAAGEAPEGQFGSSVALSAAGTLLVGAPGDEGHVGSVYVFDPAGEAWTQRSERLAGAESEGRPTFGASTAVSADGSVAIVGGPHDNGKVGAAWAFEDLPASTREPVIDHLSPSAGPSGTTVAISGENLSGASAVNFGPNPATSFTVVSANTIDAVAPSGTGRVDVIVTTPAGTSGITGHDRFTFEGPAPETAQGGVLGTSVAVSANCKALLLHKQIAVSAKAHAPLRLSQHGSSTCRGQLRISVLRDHSGHFVRKTIGSASFAIPAGSARTINVTLNHYGRRLLARLHGHMKAKLSILKLSPGVAHRSSATLHLSMHTRH